MSAAKIKYIFSPNTISLVGPTILGLLLRTENIHYTVHDITILLRLVFHLLQSVARSQGPKIGSAAHTKNEKKREHASPRKFWSLKSLNRDSLGYWVAILHNSEDHLLQSKEILTFYTSSPKPLIFTRIWALHKRDFQTIWGT